MMKLRALATLTAVVAITAGCSDVRVIDLGGGQNYYDGAFELATQSGSINTAIVGSPFAASTSVEFDEKVADSMRGGPFGRDVKFIPSPRNKEKNAFHIVVIFNSAHSFTYTEACENDVEIATKPNTKTTSMHAVFCQGNFRISSASGFVDDLKGIDDPRFHELVNSVARDMIPRYDDNRSSGGEAFR
jgi:hypothetical protein